MKKAVSESLEERFGEVKIASIILNQLIEDSRSNHPEGYKGMKGDRWYKLVNQTLPIGEPIKETEFSDSSTIHVKLNSSFHRV